MGGGGKCSETVGFFCYNVYNQNVLHRSESFYRTQCGLIIVFSFIMKIHSKIFIEAIHLSDIHNVPLLIVFLFFFIVDKKKICSVKRRTRHHTAGERIRFRLRLQTKRPFHNLNSAYTPKNKIHCFKVLLVFFVDSCRRL